MLSSERWTNFFVSIGYSRVYSTVSNRSCFSSQRAHRDFCALLEPEMIELHAINVSKMLVQWAQLYQIPNGKSNIIMMMIIMMGTTCWDKYITTLRPKLCYVRKFFFIIHLRINCMENPLNFYLLFSLLLSRVKPTATNLVQLNTDRV